MGEIAFTLEEQRAMAQAMFPHEWAETLTITGKLANRRRGHLRARAVAETIMAPLRTAGARCASCTQLRRSKFTGRGKVEKYCALKSDSEGFVIVPDDFLCPDWSAK